jgi:hypothetical protein
MKLTTAALVLATAIAAAAYGAQQVAEIKGLRLGMTPEQVNALHPQLQCSPGSDECFLDTTTVSKEFELRALGGFDVRKWELHFVDGKLAKLGAVLFERHDDELAAALAEKYGKPRDVAVPMSNGFGAKFVWHILEWRVTGGTISIVKTGSDTFPTSVDLVGPAWGKHQAEQEKSAAKRRAGGL